jgi:hypothetical protein
MQEKQKEEDKKARGRGIPKKEGRRRIKGITDDTEDERERGKGQDILKRTNQRTFLTLL